MKLQDLSTPCLVLDRSVLQRNLDTMARAVGKLGVALRPHLKTAKSIDVARLALATQDVTISGITVSTLAEARYIAANGLRDMLYAVGITPQKLDDVARLNAAGADVMVITDDADMASIIGAHRTPPRTLIELDCGEHRGGITPDGPLLLDIAARLGPALAGIMTHSGHTYGGRSVPDMVAMAESERRDAVAAAARLREAGFACPIVSVGSSPAALHAASLEGVTETRPGVYMFGDLFQAEIGTQSHDDLAVTVLTSVIGRRPEQRRLLLDAGGIALSKDRSTEATNHDWGFGHMRDLAGRPSFGHAIVRRANQEHGVVEPDPALAFPALGIGDKVRVATNHVCMTVAAHDRYYVVDGEGDEVVAVWQRVNGW